ncbi:MAG: galactonate dehydratase [Candidatus Bathyarchaeia archaeon]
MKIRDIETLFVGRWLFVRVHTDTGITGLGESGTWGYLEASERAIQTFKRYLIGQDPLRIEHHWQYLYRNSHFRGAAIMGAISSIDIALWDIAGKYFNVPAYQLLGGKCRDKARVYVHIFGRTTEELVAKCAEAKKKGFTAMGHISPFLDEPRERPYYKTHAEKIGEAADRVRKIREAVGDEIDLCIEIHRRLTPAEAIVLAREIEPFRPFFYEDPVPPDNFDAMAQVANHVNIPIATGERLHTIFEFEMLLKRCAVHYVRPDVCMAGGLTHAKKIAALAEAHNAGVVPHNPLSPVSTAACLQLDACIPNFSLQEYPFRPELGRAPGDDLLREPLKVQNGYLLIPDKPGIGVELNDKVLEKYPYAPRKFVTRLHEDGSVVDQ